MKRRRILKWIGWIILTPILLFIIIMILLYVPPVQNFIRKQVNSQVSKMIDMDLNVGRIDLRFPLNLRVRDVDVVQKQDTLLSLGNLNVSVQLLPLFKGQINVDKVALDDVKINSVNLIDGMRVEGELGSFFLSCHGINLSTEEVLVNKVELSDTNINLILTDTTTTEKVDTTSAPINWKVDINSFKLSNVAFEMQTPADSTSMYVKLDQMVVKEVGVDLKNNAYELKRFLLDNGSFKMNTGSAKPTEGFDASHIALNKIKIDIDSIRYHGRDLNAVIQECSMYERSGLTISSLTGRVTSDSTLIKVPYFKLQTPHSQINFSAQTYWELINIPTAGRLSSRFDALIGKQDVMLFAGNLPEQFKEEYPFRPLIIQAGTDGNLKQMQISRIRVDLPGAFTIDGGGELYNLTDSIRRSADIDLKMQTKNLDFLTPLAGMSATDPLVIPDSMMLDLKLSMDGPQLNADLLLEEGGGLVSLTAGANLKSEVYNANFKIDNFQVQHFLPKESIYGVSVSVNALGKGFNPMSKSSVATIKASVDKFQYGKFDVAGIKADATLKNALAKVDMVSDNSLLKMVANAEYNLASKHPEGSAKVDVTYVDLVKLGVLNEPLKNDLAFTFDGLLKSDSIAIDFLSGDLVLDMNANMGLDKMIDKSSALTNEITSQLKNHALNIDKLKEILPDLSLDITAGKNNVLAWYLETKKMSYDDIEVSLDMSHMQGVYGDLAIHTFKMDTLQLDTIYFDIRQDTSKIVFDGGVINGPKNPRVEFKANIEAQLSNDDAQVMLKFLDAQDKTGILFGINAKPLREGQGKGDGTVFRIIPENPIIAYHQFSFVDNENWVYLHKNMRVYANVNMYDPRGMGIRVQSLATDTVSLQNIDVELRNIQLAEICSVLPFMPNITGLFTAGAHYIQTEKSLQLSSDVTIDSLTYEKQLVGDLGIGATWFPGEDGIQHLTTYIAHNDKDVFAAAGALYPTSHKKDSVIINSNLNHFPTSIANVFIPTELASLSGDIDGDIRIRGYLDSPIVKGNIVMDSVSVNSAQYGAKFTLGKTPLVIKDSRLFFNKYSIYTTSTNPFTIDGYIDFRDLNNPLANLTMKASDYELLNAKRSKESLVYGKAYIGMNATIRGPLSMLQMRGKVSLLGNTDVTYIYTDSPLAVQDRLSGLVTFTSFSDTLSTTNDKIPTVSFGGLDLVLGIEIAPSVVFNIDLTEDESNRIQVQGGGNLSFKYTPQGVMTLTGRYTLSSGSLKFSLPIIPLKEFQVVSGSYVDFLGDPTDPLLNITASEKMRASVGMSNGSSQMVNFVVSIIVKNKLENLSLAFEISAPENAEVQNQLAMMGPDERSKQAIAMLATGIYLADSGSGGGFNMGSALNSVLSSQLNSLMGNMKNANLSVGVENNTSEAGGKQTDYSFSYSQRFFNNRVQIVIGGKVSTGADVSYSAESFINNISLEYRLDDSSTRYIRIFYDKNYESLLEGEITEGGVGLVLRKKLDKLSELFIFKRKKKNKIHDNENE